MIPSSRRPLRPLRSCAAALLLVTVAAATQAQTVYRCGPDGRQLQQSPCDRPVPPGAGATEPSAEDRAAAAARARKESELANRMERDRLAREREEAKHAAGAVGIGGAKPVPAKADAKADPKHGSKKKSSKHAAGSKTGDFAAFSPAAPKAKKK